MNSKSTDRFMFYILAEQSYSIMNNYLGVNLIMVVKLFILTVLSSASEF